MISFQDMSYPEKWKPRPKGTKEKFFRNVVLGVLGRPASNGSFVALVDVYRDVSEKYNLQCAVTIETGGDEILLFKTPIERVLDRTRIVEGLSFGTMQIKFLGWPFITAEGIKLMTVAVNQQPSVDPRSAYFQRGDSMNTPASWQHHDNRSIENQYDESNVREIMCRIIYERRLPTSPDPKTTPASVLRNARSGWTISQLLGPNAPYSTLTDIAFFRQPDSTGFLPHPFNLRVTCPAYILPAMSDPKNPPQTT